MLYLGPLKELQGRAGANDDGKAVPDWPTRYAELAAGARDARLRAFYAAGVPGGDTALAAVPMVALDLETTGLDPRRDEIVSVGVVPMDLACIRASASRHWVVRPRRALDTESVTLHGITHSQVAAAPDLGQVLGELLEALAGRIVVVHCRAIERGFLAAALRERIGETLTFAVIDTMELEARVHRPCARGWWARLFDRSPRASLRLADARARYGLPRYRPHHALSDALATAELLQAQIAYRYAADTPLAVLWR